MAGSVPPMAEQLNLRDALAALGLDAATTDVTVVRSAYLAAIRTAHPDRNAAAGATAASARLTVAYRVATDALVAGVRTPDSDETLRPADRTNSAVPLPPRGPEPVVITVDVRVIADDTIEDAAPPDLTFAWLVQTGHVAGAVTFLDRSAALLQILVAFVDEPVCQMIFDLQGRAAHGTTEVFCTIDSIEDRPAPPIDAVTRFIAEHLAETISAG